jgi:transcription elongation GreA/GreB family factor
VTIRCGDAEETFAIRDESHRLPPWGSCHADTPLAQALIGKGVNEVVEFQVHPLLPVRSYTVVSIVEVLR